MWNIFTLRTLRWTGTLAIIASLSILGLSYSGLPDQIPIHYNHQGEVDKYGPKSDLWIIPVLAALMFYGIIRSNKWILKMNPKLKKKELFVISWGSHILSLIIALSFSYITFQTIFIAKNGSGTLGFWFLPVFVISMIILPILPWILYRKKK